MVEDAIDELKRLRKVLRSLYSEELEPGTWGVKCIEDHNAIIKEALGDHFDEED